MGGGQWRSREHKRWREACITGDVRSKERVCLSRAAVITGTTRTGSNQTLLLMDDTIHDVIILSLPSNRSEGCLTFPSTSSRMLLAS